MLARDIISDAEEAYAAGIAAALQAVYDKEIIDGVLSDGAKRYIRREIRRTCGKSLKSRSLVDYGYQHGSIGRRGPKGPPKSALQKRRHAYMAAGLCTTCGREPVPGLVSCQHCREKRKEYNRKARSKKREL